MCGDVHVEATSAVLREVSGGRFFAEARLRPAGYDAPAFARSACLAEAGAACEGWWSQAGSNRRPRHCERRALPAELWPHRDRHNGIGGQQSAPFTIRAKAKSRTAKSPFPKHLSGTSLVCEGGNRYLA